MVQIGAYQISMNKPDHFICERCLKPVDPDTGCATHRASTVLNRSNPHDLDWEQSLKRMRSEQRSRRFNLVFWLGSFPLLTTLFALQDGFPGLAMAMLASAGVMMLFGPIVWQLANGFEWLRQAFDAANTRLDTARWQTAPIPVAVDPAQNARAARSRRLQRRAHRERAAVPRAQRPLW